MPENVILCSVYIYWNYCSFTPFLGDRWETNLFVESAADKCHKLFIEALANVGEVVHLQGDQLLTHKAAAPTPTILA